MTEGNSSSVMGWVLIVVDTGDSCHSLYELEIMLMATAKQVTTMTPQTTLPIRDWAVEICTSPCIVEFSKKSFRAVEAMLNLFRFQPHVEPEGWLETEVAFCCLVATTSGKAVTCVNWQLMNLAKAMLQR